MTYSNDYRRLAFIRYQQTGRVRLTARMLEVSPSTIHRWKGSSAWGTLATRKPAKVRRPRKLTDDACTMISAFFEANCTASVHLARQALRLGISATSIHRALKRLEVTRKRLSSKVLGFVSTEKVVDYRARHAACVSESTLVVSLDECSFSEKVQPLYGYAPAGHRCVLRLKGGGWKQRSLLLGISTDGDYTYSIRDGAFNRESFGEFILELPYPPETVILLDNCAIHKGLDDVFAAKGYIPLFLSPYSPQFQPMELAFSKAKQHFRSLWPWLQGIVDAIKDSVRSLTVADVAGYFRHAQRMLEMQ